MHTDPSVTATVSALPPPPPADMPHFERSRNGYHPDQVHQWAAALLGRIRELERLGGHGAKDAAHAAESPQGQAMLADLIKAAADELSGQQVKAAAAAADLMRRVDEEAAAKLEDAGRQAAEILRRADDEATKLVAGAREQADTVLQTAHAQARDTTDRASAHAAAVHEGAQRRLDALAGLHEETMRRIKEINDVTGKTLAADTDRGSMADEVARVLSALDPHPLQGETVFPAPALPPAES